MRWTVSTCTTIFVIALTMGQSSYAELKNNGRTKMRSNVPKELSYSPGPRSAEKWQLRTAPIALLAKWITLDGSYLLSEQVSFGPSAILYGSPKGERGGMLAPAYNGYAVGMNGTYFFRSAFKNTWYASLHTYYQNYLSYGHGTSEDDVTKVNGFKANTAAGFQWRWSKFSMLIGGGAELRNQNETQIRNEKDGSTTDTASKDP